MNIFQHIFPIQPYNETIGYRNGQQFHLQLMEDDLQKLTSCFFEVDIPTFLSTNKKIRQYYSRKTAPHYHDFMYIFQDLYIQFQIVDRLTLTLKQPAYLFSIDSTTREGYAELYETNLPYNQDNDYGKYESDIYFSQYVKYIPIISKKQKKKKTDENDLLTSILEQQTKNDEDDKDNNEPLNKTIDLHKPTKMNVRSIPIHIYHKIQQHMNTLREKYSTKDTIFRCFLVFDFSTQNEPTFQSCISKLYSHFGITLEKLGLPTDQGIIFP